MTSKYPDIKPRLVPAITTAEINFMWYNRNKGIIKEWLLNHKSQNVIDEKSNNGYALMSLNFSLMIIVAVYHIL
jgi:hypothetical protein